MKTKITNEKFLEMSSEIASDIIENRIGNEPMWQKSIDGIQRLTEEAQDLYNETLDIVQEKLLNYLEITNLP